MNDRAAFVEETRSPEEIRGAIAECLESYPFNTAEILDLFGIPLGEQENWHQRFRKAGALALNAQTEESFASLGRVVAQMVEIGMRGEV